MEPPLPLGGEKVKNSQIVAVLILSLGLNIGMGYVLLHERVKRTENKGWHEGGARRHFCLRKEQAGALEEQRLQALKKLEPLRREYNQRRRELWQALKRGVTGEEKDALALRLAETRSRMELLSLEYTLRVRELLPSEGREKLEKLFQMSCGDDEARCKESVCPVPER